MTEGAEDIALPGVLAQVAEAAGLAAALALAAARGGRVAYIPRPDRLKAGHWLVEAMGPEAARKVARALGAGHIEIPLGPLAGTRARAWATLRRALAEGRSAAEAARLAGVSLRTVRRHRNGHSGEAAPLPLFQDSAGGLEDGFDL